MADVSSSANYSKPLAARASNDELLTVANDIYGMGWDTQTQIVNRRGWLQSAGMLTDMGDGKVKLSEKGQLLLSEIAIYDPTSGPAVIKVVEGRHNRISSRAITAARPTHR